MTFLNPAILALTLAVTMVSLALLPATLFSMRVLRHWDISSGSEHQLRLERSTYLISTLMTVAFAIEGVALLLFIYNAEALSSQFVGAMCATGVLNANAFGWPALLAKILTFFSATLWLQLNRLDHMGEDYPLTRRKYLLLLLIAPLFWASAALQSLFFLELDPQVITSCCGSLFSSDGAGVAAELSSLTPQLAALFFLSGGAAVAIIGAWGTYRHGTGLYFALASSVAFVSGLSGIVSFISPYVYEHPHHHCPFCILKAGHDFVGYLLYIPLFAATAFALGAGAIALQRHIPSLRPFVQQEEARAIRMALIGFTCFYLMSLYLVARSNLRMQEVWW